MREQNPPPPMPDMLNGLTTSTLSSWGIKIRHLLRTIWWLGKQHQLYLHEGSTLATPSEQYVDCGTSTLGKRQGCSTHVHTYIYTDYVCIYIYNIHTLYTYIFLSIYQVHHNNKGIGWNWIICVRKHVFFTRLGPLHISNWPPMQKTWACGSLCINWFAARTKTRT